MVEFGMHDAQIDSQLFQDYWAVWPRLPSLVNLLIQSVWDIIDEVITFGGAISGGCNRPAALL